MANFCSETGKSYPSVETVCGMTCQNDKTVRRALKQLTELGFLTDTGKKAGPTQRVKVYQLPEEAWKVVIYPKTGRLKVPSNPPEIPPESTQIRVVEPGTGNQEPKTGDGTPRQQCLNGNGLAHPSLEEMVAFGRTIDLPKSESEGCFYYYESNGWKVGKNPMKSWQAAMRNWYRTYKQRNGHAKPDMSGRRY